MEFVRAVTAKVKGLTHDKVGLSVLLITPGIYRYVFRSYRKYRVDLARNSQ